MSTPLLATLAVFAFLPFGHPKPAVDHAYALGRWRLDVHQDTFQHEVRCRLADDYGHFPGVIAGPRALVLKLPGHIDGSLAWFSVDGAPAQPWRDVEAALIAGGAMANAEALDNATGGELALPYSVVNGASTIAVQTTEGGIVRMYRMGRFWDLVASAQRLGCNLQIGNAGR